MGVQENLRSERLIPLLSRSGAVIDYAQVDLSDFAELSQYVWRRLSNTQGQKIKYYAYRYVAIGGRCKPYGMHRQILGLPLGRGSFEADHLNGDTLDNRRINLRKITHAQNMQNKQANTFSTSRYRGVYWHKGNKKWHAAGRMNGKKCHIGYFRDEQGAAIAAANWRAINMPYAQPSVV